MVTSASLRGKCGAKKKNAPETKEELPRRDFILSLTPTVFTAAADWEGLLQCACEVAVITGCI